MTPELEELLLEAKGEELGLGPTPSDRERVRQRLRLAIGGSALLATSGLASKAAAGSAALGVAGAAEVGTASGASFLSGVSGLKLAGWLLVGSALGLGGAWTSRGLLGVETSGAAVVENHSAATLPKPALPNPTLPSRESPAKAEVSPLASLEAPPVEPKASLKSDVSHASAASGSKRLEPVIGSTRKESQAALASSGLVNPQSLPSIREEMRRLKAAEAALSRGDLVSAQREIDTSRGAQLLPERLGLSAITACRAGDKARAERLYAELLARFPATPILPRVRADLGAGCTAPKQPVVVEQVEATRSAQTSTDAAATKH
ncbi:MAG: hypothetical protein KC492_25430 [Myxococcales bacterium]|nr:hypothetical protein [Myxococcales bacterium]